MAEERTGEMKTMKTYTEGTRQSIVTDVEQMRGDGFGWEAVHRQCQKHHGYRGGVISLMLFCKAHGMKKARAKLNRATVTAIEPATVISGCLKSIDLYATSQHRLSTAFEECVKVRVQAKLKAVLGILEKAIA